VTRKKEDWPTKKYPIETEPREKKVIGRPRKHPIETEPRETKTIGGPRKYPIETEPREKKKIGDQVNTLLNWNQARK
jgi:hypothetical protein